jgi:hypothetical protein
MQNLRQSTSDPEILYTDRFSNDERLLMRPLLLKEKNTKMAGG